MGRIIVCCGSCPGLCRILAEFLASTLWILRVRHLLAGYNTMDVCGYYSCLPVYNTAKLMVQGIRI